MELIEVYSENLERSFMVAKDEWESGKTLLTTFSPLDGNVLGFPHNRLLRDNISATGPKLSDGTTAQVGMAEAIEIERQTGHTTENKRYRENISNLHVQPTFSRSDRKLGRIAFPPTSLTLKSGPAAT